MFLQECAMKRSEFLLISLFYVPFPWCMYVCTTAADDTIAWILNVCQVRELFWGFQSFRRFQSFDCALLLCSAGVCISYCHLFTEWTLDADVRGYNQHNAIECFFIIRYFFPFQIRTVSKARHEAYVPILSLFL